MNETDIEQAIFELREMARLLRQFPTDRVVCGAVGAVLERAKKMKFHAGHPLEAELREATGDFCFACRDWWKGPGVLLFGPDVAAEKARQCELAGHLITLTAGEVEPFCLTRSVEHDFDFQ
jgi:hypothetical protein